MSQDPEANMRAEGKGATHTLRKARLKSDDRTSCSTAEYRIESTDERPYRHGSPLGPLGAGMEDHAPKMKLFGISHHSCENEKFIRVFLVWSPGEAMTSSYTLCTSLWPDKECSYRSSQRVLLQARKAVRLASYALW